MIKEFREKGFLHEANRQFFHPLGLALAINLDENGDETLGGIWDYRYDPEGMFFGEKELSQAKIDYVAELRKSKHTTRFFSARNYGFKVDSRGVQEPNV